VARKAAARTSGKASATIQRVGLLTVGEMAAILGVSPSTLRFWENVGLVTPARSNGRYRLYSHELIEVLKRIKYLRDVKRLNLPGIRQELGKQPKTGSEAKASHEAQTDRPTDLGAKLRKMRQKSGLGLHEAARTAKISPGFLSSLELSRANPSVATLQRLASTYGTTVLDFYGLPKRFNRLMRRRDRRAIRTQSGVRMEPLSIGSRQIESTIWHIKPGAGSDGMYSHQGEEFIYVMAGELELWLDELERYTLREGDSFWFDSSTGHRWYNPSNEETILLWINSPPTF
jgi:DNA-binding transcriptional MerR regulator/quercetin dioxygenase-like cupin family protein